MRVAKRVLVPVLVIIIILTGLSGCGRFNETAMLSKAGNSINTDQQPADIEFWDMVWGPKEAIETGMALVDRFNTSQRKIKVKYQSIPWNNWYQTFATAIASGTAPDISTGAGYQPFQFAEVGAILPIDDVIAEIKSSGDDKDFIGNVIELLKYNGHYIAFPWSFDGRIMWYRKDLFDAAGIQAPPESFDEFRADAGKLTKDGNYGFAFAGADSGAFQTMLSFMINNGGGFFNTEGKPDLMNVRNVETLKLFSDMVKVDKSINPACVGYNADDMSKIFGSGKCAMMISNPGIIDKNHVFPGLETDIEIKPYE